MKFTASDDYITLQFNEEKLTTDIKDILSKMEINPPYDKKVAQIQHKKIAELNIHEVSKLCLPQVYPHRLTIQTRGRPTTPAFSVKCEFIGPRSEKFYQVKRTGVILNLDGNLFTLTNPQFELLEKLKKLSPHIKNIDERLNLWHQVKEVISEEIDLDNKELLDIQFIKADRFCLDIKKLSRNEFQIVPELIYKTIDDEENQINRQIPMGVSGDFKKEFLKINTVDPYYKVNNYYIKLGEPLRECLKIIKKVNKESPANKQAFYSNPMKRIKEEIPKNFREDLLEEIFFETDEFKSDRISYIGKWVPKIGIYIDPENKNSWFPKDDIVITIGDQLFHCPSNKLDSIIEDLEQEKKENKAIYVYENQAIPINNEVISELKDVRDNIIKEAQKYIPSSEASTQSIEKLVAIIKDNFDTQKYQSSIKKRLHLKNYIPSCLEDKFNKYPYQKKGLSWLEDNFIEGLPGALLADDMGLGKTFQALAFLYWYKESVKQKKPILIVAPTGLLKNWQDEHNMHLLISGGLGRKYKAYGESFRSDRRNDTFLTVIEEMKKSAWVLATYESIRDHHTEYFIKISWGVTIFDEIQKIKNPNTLITNASKALDSDFSIGLTGTPIENSFIDLWCISDCLYPKILGLLRDFNKKYIINKNENRGQDIYNQLMNRKPPFILRRMKEDVLDSLPKKEIISERVQMTDEQAKRYSEVIRKERNKEYSSSLQALALLKRLSIYIEDASKDTNKEFINSSGKLKKLFETLENIKIKNEKILICIENKNLQKKIKEICDAKWNLEMNIINGDVAGEKRKGIIDDFSKTSGFNILIISPRAGGVGLNIVAANHIIHLERWWNPAVEEQSTDRIFRIGQTRPVFIYYFLSVHSDYEDDSFDIELDKLLKKKMSQSTQIFSLSEPADFEKNEFYRNVTKEERMYFDNKGSFYNTEEWKNLRRMVFNKFPLICMRCGNKKNLEVDHVKPRSKYSKLELDIDNLQILCRDCNTLKGVTDSLEWDFRKKQI